MEGRIPGRGRAATVKEGVNVCCLKNHSIGSNFHLLELLGRSGA